MKTSSFKLSVTIPAKPDEVYAALTDSKRIAQWCGQKGTVSSKVDRIHARVSLSDAAQGFDLFEQNACSMRLCHEQSLDRHVRTAGV